MSLIKMARLSEADVESIRNAVGYESMIAKKFGVPKSLVEWIRSKNKVSVCTGRRARSQRSGASV